MTVRQAIVLFCVCLVAGGWWLFTPTSSAGTDCGSVVAPVSFMVPGPSPAATATIEIHAEDCRGQLVGRRNLAIIVVMAGAGVLVVVAGRARAGSVAHPSAHPTE